MMYDTYLELLFHFNIYLDSQNEKKTSKGLSYINWANNLFPNVKGPNPVDRLSPKDEHEIEEDLPEQYHTWTSKRLEGEFKSGTIFQSYHYQAT